MLGKTLEALARQTPPPGGFEVVVVNDGGGAEVAETVGRVLPSFPGDLVSLSIDASGPAAARNAGAAAAIGELLLFLGSDTRPCDGELLRAHVDLHVGRASTFAVLGRVVWDEEASPPTPLMEWLVRSRTQFAFDELAPGRVAADRYLYAAHVSLRRDLLQTAGGFDARFPFAAVEDVELGVRLERLGIELEYHPELVVAHDHPTDLAASLERACRVGQSAAVFHRMHPGCAHPDLRAPSTATRIAAFLASPLERLAGGRSGPRLLREPLWRVLHALAYARGYAQGRPLV